MRLINTQTLQLEEFPDERDVEYAILSHRWGKEEISFQDMQVLGTAVKKHGFDKIKNSCLEAVKRGYEYIWVDTCCIDKSSSAELSEAINSMFRWYKNSQECFAYLADVTSGNGKIAQDFLKSEWFSRGWTLQELLAPSQVHFFDSSWTFFGSRNNLSKEIADATGININAFSGQNLLQFSIAERMSWAAKRKTTRAEDRAYSLMGLFNINMPMLYGEGEKAFLRLQEEILKHSDDHSLFAWTGVPSRGCGMLADRLDRFADAGKITPFERSIVPGDVAQKYGAGVPYFLTNRGLSVQLLLTPWWSKTYLALLDCKCSERGEVGIFLWQTSQTQFRRVHPEGTADIMFDIRKIYSSVRRDLRSCAVHVQQDGLSSSVPVVLRPADIPIYGVYLMPSSSVDLREYVCGRGTWNRQDGIAELKPGRYGAVADIKLSGTAFDIQAIRIGLDFDFRPRCVFAGLRHLNTTSRTPTRRHEDALKFGSKLIWDVTFNETEGWVGGQQQRSRSILRVEPLVRSATEDSDMWAIELGSAAKHASFRLVRQNKRTSRPVDQNLGMVTITESSYRNLSVWGIQIDLHDRNEVERRETAWAQSMAEQNSS